MIFLLLDVAHDGLLCTYAHCAHEQYNVCVCVWDGTYQDGHGDDDVT